MANFYGELVLTDAERRRLFDHHPAEPPPRAAQPQTLRVGGVITTHLTQVMIERLRDMANRRPLGFVAETDRGYIARAEANAKRHREAQEKAQELFFGCLSREQRQSWLRYRHIVVDGEFFRYRIVEGRFGNVTAFDASGDAVYRLCCYPGGEIPVFDVMAGQKLALEAREVLFLRKAVASPLLGFEERRSMQRRFKRYRNPRLLEDARYLLHLL